MRQPSFRVRFWGVRGSYPTSTETTLGYGGHTSCVEVQAGGQRLIFDAGTGIIPLGKKLMNDGHGARTLNLFLSHTHHDHVFGFYFFEPLFRSTTQIHIFGSESPRNSLRDTLQTVMDPRFFPLSLKDVDARTKVYSLKGNESIEFRNAGSRPLIKPWLGYQSDGELTVRAHKSRAHPNGVMLYRVYCGDRSMVYATDVEQKQGGYLDIIEFIRGADLLIHDAQYLASEYGSKKGWGHSTIERAAEVARKAGVKRLVLFHHEPTHDDATLKRMGKLGQRLFRPTLVAYEGLEIHL